MTRAMARDGGSVRADDTGPGANHTGAGANHTGAGANDTGLEARGTVSGERMTGIGMGRSGPARSSLPALARRLRSAAASACLGVAVAVSTVVAAPVTGVTPAYATEQTLNYRDADIRAFIDDVAMLTNSTFIVDPRVKGQVTVISRTAMERDDIFDVFLATLRVNGFAVTSMPNGAYKILPSTAAVQDAALSQHAGESDRFVTEVFKLNHVDGTAAVDMLKPLVNSDGRVVSNRGSDFVVVVDYASNMARIRQVIQDIDRDLSVLRALPLDNTPAEEMKRIIESLHGGRDDNMRKAAVTAVAVPGTNTLVLRGDNAAVTRMAAFVTELDSTNRGRDRGVEVMTLQYHEAEDLVPLLQSVSASIVKAETAEGQTTTAAPDATVHIGFHKETNSLVVNADADMRRELRAVIQQIDQPRRQVLVEAIIVEVSDQAAKELGLQYVLSGDGSDSKVPFTATSFSNSAPNILAATGALIATNEADGEDSDVLTQLQQAAVDSLLGASGFLGGFGGQFSDGTIFGVILNALQSDTNSNVLATPSLMTLDNEEASLIVGQEIPITTGEVLGQNFENPFRTVERQNVGIELEVTPQITDGGPIGPNGERRPAIKMEIRQEASSILGPVTQSSSDLILNKRELQTNVVVENGEVIVLGGLIEDNEQISVEAIPLLGDIPVIGRLFRSEAKSRTKTNLMVFLRPTIVSDRSERDAATAQRYDYIRVQQEVFGAGSETTLDYFTTNVLNGEIPGSGAAPSGP